jgi:hypothetical protein
MPASLTPKPPSLIGIFFGALLSIVLGGLLGVVAMAARPVEVVKAMPKEPVEGTRYFVEGAAPGYSRTWEAKVEQLKAGAVELRFTEAELNAWAGKTFKVEEVKEEQKAGVFLIIAGKPNFRFAGEELQVGMVNELVLFGTTAPLVIQAQGNLARASGGAWSLNAKEAWLGGFPLHKFPPLMQAVSARFGAAERPEELTQALTKANRLEIADGTLVVDVP